MKFAILKSGSIVLGPLPRWTKDAPVFVTLADVHNELRRHSPAVRMSVPVDSYFVAVPEPLLEPLVAWTLREAAAFGLSYTPESYDCDDFACDFDRTASKSAALAGIKAAPAVGFLSVRQQHEFARVPAGGFHALAVVMTDRGVRVVETQNGFTCPLETYPNRSNIVSADAF